MEGQLGVLYQDGKQIGGFLNWRIQHSLVPISSSDRWGKYKPSTWKATGASPWLIEKPVNDIFDVVFYKFMAGKLVENYRDKIRALLPNSYPLNEHLKFTLLLYHWEETCCQ